ncbi:OsmC family protein [Natronobacterium texcoconense]|uniref:Biotin-requiring enzyme n=1 Tax=Natronobacterium texcoconense TaxID=1095778 RepID=A0A1H1FGP9_NATTX|nr:OsmC family protein [Natronobacterium texcoconense]SDR00125.1 Biotin-requiring enzyme [Natronobacterium texcoconense]
MRYIVRVPKLDGGMQATLREWHLEEGEALAEGHPIASFESGASDVTLEARENGVLRRTFLEEGETVSSGTPVGIVAPAETDVEDLETALEHVEGAFTVLPADGRNRPSETEMPGRTATATNPEGMSGRLETGSFEWRYDEPASYGGTETGPTPVDVFLGGLAACLSLSTRYQVEKRNADVDEISVTTDATPERGPVESIAVTVFLESDEDDETLVRIVDLAERGCHVSQLLRDDLELELSWSRC